MGGRLATFTSGPHGMPTTNSAHNNERNERVRNLSTQWRNPVVLAAKSVNPRVVRTYLRGTVYANDDMAVAEKTRWRELQQPGFVPVRVVRPSSLGSP